MRPNPARSRLWSALGIGAVVGLVLNAAWEVGQYPLYDRNEARGSHVLGCLRGAGGDLIILAGCYLAASLTARTWYWPIQQRVLGWAAIFVAVGLAITVVFERWALSVGRWSYGATMPLILGIGLAPVLQWLVVPVATLAVVRASARGQSRGHRP